MRDLVFFILGWAAGIATIIANTRLAYSEHNGRDDFNPRMRNGKLIP